MVHIRAENLQIEKEIQNLVDLVEQGDGGFHSKMVIESDEHGGLSIKTTEPMARGKELIRISKNVVLPTDQCEITVRGDDLTYDFKKGNNLTDLQKKLFDSMMALYNFSGKVAFQKDVSFLLGLKDHVDIFDKILSARTVPKKFQDFTNDIKAGLEGEEYNRFIAGMFIKTRQLGYADHVRYTNVSILMPVIDFMNHHWYGAAFGAGQGPRAGDLVVNTSQPVKDSTQCYAYYGPMDAMDTLIRYDFMDTQAPVVRSVPLSLDVMGMGTLEIKGNFGGFYKGKLSKIMKPLQQYVPATRAIEEEDRLVANYILIPYQDSPRALRHVLSFLLTSFLNKFEIEQDISDEQRKAWIMSAEEKIISKNKEYYEDILSTLKILDGDKGRDYRALKALNDLCNLQLMKLNGYNVQELAA